MNEICFLTNTRFNFYVWLLSLKPITFWKKPLPVFEKHFSSRKLQPYRALFLIDIIVTVSSNLYSHNLHKALKTRLKKKGSNAYKGNCLCLFKIYITNYIFIFCWKENVSKYELKLNKNKLTITKSASSV